MQLLKALRLDSALQPPRLALVGAGGKTSALFQIARQLQPPVILTATTHLGLRQTALADRWIVANSPADLPGEDAFHTGVQLVTGQPDSTGRTIGLDLESLARLLEITDRLNCPLLVEADGSRQLPLKAPADHEPAIPEFVDTVIVVAGLSGLGKPLSREWVHRPERFSQLTGLQQGEIITADVLACYLLHPQGGLKRIPLGARKIALLNQADGAFLRSNGNTIGVKLIPKFDSALVASLENPSIDPAGPVFAMQERSAGVILAAGASRRYGQPKLLLPWNGEAILRHVARAALDSGLDPVVVVAGEHIEGIRQALSGLEVKIAQNPDWEQGQSSSLKAGLSALQGYFGSVVFLLGDQPQIPPTLIRSLLEHHVESLAPVVAPLVDGQRANPVLFDRVTFPELMQLTGDTGGRVLFSRYPVEWLEWQDDNVLFDIDKPEDYRRLLDGSNA